MSGVAGMKHGHAPRYINGAWQCKCGQSLNASNQEDALIAMTEHRNTLPIILTRVPDSYTTTIRNRRREVKRLYGQEYKSALAIAHELGYSKTTIATDILYLIQHGELERRGT